MKALRNTRKPFVLLAVALISLSFFCSARSSYAATFCVADESQLQNALSTASSNGQDDVIRIVQGTYYGNFVYASTEAFDLIIEGGYNTGCLEITLDPTNTILDAQYNGRVLALTAPEVRVSLTLSGFSMQNGNYGDMGGGLYVNANSADLDILHVVIHNNSRCGFYLQANTVDISSTTISNNQSASLYGQVILADEAKVSDSLIIENHIQNDAGGLTINARFITFINNTVSGNISDSARGGGIYLNGSVIELTDNNISHNICSRFAGGGVYASAAVINVSNNTISFNQAHNEGGGIVIVGSSQARIISNIIRNNTSESGGGIHIVNANNAYVINNIISDNTAVQLGGGVRLGEAHNTSVTHYLINNTIVGNNSSLPGGGGVFVSMEMDGSCAEIHNNLIYGNSADAGNDIYIENDRNFNSIASQVRLFNSNLSQSSAGTYIQMPFAIDFSNLNNADPLFVDPDNGDYHLREGSPCINTGSNAAPGLPGTDKDGIPRIVGSSVDMGAYEYQGFIAPVAGFSAFPLSGVAPLTVSFADESSGTIDSWAWSFGDGATSTDRNPTHTYNAPGIYSVTLTVKGDSLSDTETKGDYITVISPDAPDLYGRCQEFHSTDFGASIKMKLQIENLGKQSTSDFSVAFYLSEDGFTFGDLLDSFQLRGKLKPGHSKDVWMKYSSPISLSVKYVIALIDSDNKILELNEINNATVIRIP